MLTCVTLSKNTAFLEAIMQKQTNALSNKWSSLQWKYVIVFHHNLENKGICSLSNLSPQLFYSKKEHNS